MNNEMVFAFSILFASTITLFCSLLILIKSKKIRNEVINELEQ